MTIEVQLLLSNFLQHWYLNDEVSHLKGRTTDLQNVMMQSSSLETVLGLWNQLWAKKKERAKKRVRVGLRWTVIDKSSFAAQRMIGVVLGGSSGDKNSFRTDRLQITKKNDRFYGTHAVQLRNSLTLPTRVNTVISISHPEVSFGEYVISGFLFVVF